MVVIKRLGELDRVIEKAHNKHKVARANVDKLRAELQSKNELIQCLEVAHADLQKELDDKKEAALELTKDLDHVRKVLGTMRTQFCSIGRVATLEGIRDHDVLHRGVEGHYKQAHEVFPHFSKTVKAGKDATKCARDVLNTFSRSCLESERGYSKAILATSWAPQREQAKNATGTSQIAWAT